ncbi:hypothetical protein H2201_002140 [Coniosporium apollinis]|uniref:BTB domain-containing protein n=1 Tax=Coniosporium apollinis TaxID=61459 RepID=A0ABQ9NZ10_9PEZI|nr:hypothetical protein H2201_002140 [Coniosporium apollinis]
MVSYPDEASRTLSFRPAPSVTSSHSRATTSRRHRHHRSQGNEFPVFSHTGDVEIIIASGRKEQRYLLHRLILAQCSGFFEAGTSEEWSRAQQTGESSSAAHQARFPNGAPNADTAPRKRWRYELDWGSGPDSIPVLVQKDPSSPTSTLFGGDHTTRPPPARNKPPAPTSSFFRSMANLSSLGVSSSSHTTSQTADASDDLLRDYSNLFRIFYNHSPALDTLNIANAYVESKSLLQLADLYDALDVIGPRVDHHLLRFQGRLFKQIAKYPPSYLKLGHLARSRVIFAESLIHVVGQWPAGAAQLRGQVPEAVMELILDRVDELEELKSRVEAKLWRLTLTTPRGDRVTPGNAWLDWLAMSLFRQWLAENTTPAPAPILKDAGSRRSGGGGGGVRPGSNQSTASLALSSAPASNAHAHTTPLNTGRIFRLLGQGGAAYLGHDELKRFLKINPEFYTRENMKKFERRMDELKNLARDAVKPLMRNFLELDLGREGGGLPYLTCTKVEDMEFPWEE